MTIRTRFAPSPTGFLHIGGVRTALFSWLLARRHGGQFVLRIEDTDQERNRPEALRPILDGFRWLGLDWDEGPEVGGPHGPYFQSQRLDLYRGAALKLLAEGHAYPDYMTKEELDAERQRAADAKKPYIHRGPLRDADPADNVKKYQGRPTTLRFKVPAGRQVINNDMIAGECVQESDLLPDPVILRANGRALYNFACVVDDSAMEINHVIRAKDHLSNTFTQILVYQAMGLGVPKFGHVPLVNRPKTNKKLSKRDGPELMTKELREKLKSVGWTDGQLAERDDVNPVTVAFYREVGYLPAGVVNYLGRLGWSLDAESEYIPLGTMTANFSLDRVKDSPASFDLDKLHWLAGEYMKELPTAEKAAGCLPFLQKVGLIDGDPTPGQGRTLGAAVESAGDRLKVFSDIVATAGYLFQPEPVYDAKAVDKRLRPAEAQAALRDFVPVLKGAEPFDVPTLEAALKEFCERRGVKEGLLIHALRVSTSGVPKGLGVYDVLALYGRDEVLRRIGIGLAHVAD